ncbi:MAG: hypothetical protein MMC33_003807 [Icmadophila ericetorum]|nr:hypothetical protein [Icmadophila ericetorum]
MSTGISGIETNPSELAALCKVNDGTGPLVLTWVMLTISTIVVSLRGLVRYHSRNLGWDDYTIVLSQALALAGAIAFTKLVLAGMGQHIYCLTIQQLSGALHWSMISQILVVTTAAVIKFSVCLFVLRIIDQTRKRVHQLLWALIAFVCVVHTVQVILYIVQCRPMSALWNFGEKGECFSIHFTYLAAYIGGGFDALTDLLCALIPTLIISQLQMNRRTKIGLCILMGLGIFTAVCVIAKTVYLSGVFAFDYTFAITRSATWAAVETFVGIMAVSIPTLKPLFVKIKEMTSRRGSSSSGSWSGKRSFQKLFSPQLIGKKSPSLPSTSNTTSSSPRTNSTGTSYTEKNEKSDRQWYGATGAKEGIHVSRDRNDEESGMGLGLGQDWMVGGGGGGGD